MMLRQIQHFQTIVQENTMHYRLAAFDLDGTIIDDKKKLTRRTARALRELQKRGTAGLPPVSYPWQTSS